VTNKSTANKSTANKSTTNKSTTNKIITNGVTTDKLTRIRSSKIKWGASMLGACAILAPACASAQDAQSERLQRQLDALQSQVQSLQKQVAEQKKREAVAAQASAGTAYGADAKMPLKTKAPLLSPVKLTWGGFLAAETVFRQHNTVSDIATPFAAIPYPFSSQYSEHEFRGTARTSRLSLLVEGTIDPVQKLTGYYEMDFLGTGITSNYNQSNSWDMRLRQAHLTYDNTDWGFHLLAGQAWSLATQNTVGMTPRKENIPLVIDGSYVAGFDYIRGWQLRLVKDFGPVFSAGISAEAPAELVFATASAGAIANNGTVNGLIVNWANPGNSFLGSSSFVNNFNTETAPDVIGKLAFDPADWGHFEALGMVRFFTDSVFTCAPGTFSPVTGVCNLASTVPGDASSHVTTGWGVGGSALVHIVPKYVDVQASVLYGKGIGRYGASQLSDVVVASDGTLSPITALHALGGIVLHPWEGLDVYGYGGFERADANLFGAAVGPGGVIGFGNPNVTNIDCGLVTNASFSGAGASNCTAINKEVDMVAAGFWQNIWKGSYGRVAAGLQWELIERKSFDTVPSGGGAVSTSDNVFLTSLRYYPF
jgi:hypothetical protein